MQEDIVKILVLGVYAPSGDNHQPWRFEVIGNVIKIYNLPERDPIVYNYKQQGSLIAHGCLIETIKIAATTLGYSTQVTLLSDAGNPNLTATLVLEKSDIQADPLAQYIKQRATNRNPYKNQPLTPEQKTAFAASMQNFPTLGLKIVEGPKSKQAIGRYVAQNEKILLESPLLHHTFFEQLVWTEEQEKKLKQGLYFKTLALKGPAGPMFKLFKNWKILNFLNKTVHIANVVVSQNSKVWASSSAQIAITGKTDTPQDLLTVGMAMQRLWLTATSVGLSGQPLAGMLYLGRRLLAGVTDGFPEYQQKIILDAYNGLQNTFGIQGELPLMYLRIGDGGKPPATSSRQDPQINFI